MLQSKLNKCRILISEVKQNQQIDEENKNTAKRNNTFFDSYNNYFKPLIESYVVCKKCSHMSFSDDLVNSLNEWVDNTKKVFEQKAVINPVKYQTNYKALYDKFQNEWETKTNEYLTDTRENLGVLKLVSNDKLEIQRILQCMNNFASWPLTEVTKEQYYLADARAKDILKEIEFDDEIEAFLRKVKDKEATILDLNDNIIDWIRRENLSNNIMLSIRN